MTASATIIATMLLQLDQVEANDVALRSVNMEDPDVVMLFDNIKDKGVLTPIRVRPAFLADKKTPKTLPDGRAVYQLIDGLHRYTGALKGRLESIPAIVVTADDAEVEKQQLMANLHRIPTKPYEYGKHLKRIIARDQTRTKGELARELNVSEDFIDKRLGLNGLHADGQDEKGEPTSSIGKLVDEGRITIANATELARLKPSELQVDYVDQAMAMPPLQFAKLVKDKIKQLREDKQAGRDPNQVVGFQPTSHFRKKQDVEAEVEKPHVLAVLIKSKGITDPIEAAREALRWALSLDEQTLTGARAKWEADQKAHAAKVAERKAERAKKAQEEAEAAKKAAQAAVGA